jgi:hypothetical protein
VLFGAGVIVLYACFALAGAVTALLGAAQVVGALRNSQG